LQNFLQTLFWKISLLIKTAALFVTSLEDGKIYKIALDGAKSQFAKIEGKIAGIVFDRKGDLLVTGWAGGKTPSVFRVSASGAVETLTAIYGAMFLNGITRLDGDKFLIADSYKGAIWVFDAKTRKYSVWLEDALLARSDSSNPFPAVNGLKRFGNMLYVTNTERQKLLRIPILTKGKAGNPEVFVDKINGDDFAIDAKGNLYVTTHVYNNVVQVAPDGKIKVIAESGEGVTGSTALAFSRDKKDRQAIFVVTNGGMSLPPKDGVQPAKVVRLAIGVNNAK
jgi:sugar lactone lactonase YvrE